MIGRTLGHYRVEQRLGAGGMGEVYRAYDTRLEREVALKVVSVGQLPTADAQEYLRKEALALSRLNHPNIATVFDFDVVDGVAYVAMELLAGGDLRDRLRSGPIPEHDVLQIGIQTAAALHAAHSAGVVHRDVKPANLQLIPDGRVKVLDFGIAARLVSPDEHTQLALDSLVAAGSGTLPYMAPEQLRGAAADPRSDVYSLCIVLYEMATGHQPFDGQPQPVLIDQILNQAPAPPRQHNARMSSGLEAIVLKGLDKNPELRYQSARELLVDLERLRHPTEVRPPALPPRRDWRRWAVAAGIIVFAVAAGVAVKRWVNSPVLSFAPRDWILVTDFDNQTGDTLFDRSLATAFMIGLQQSTYTNVVPRARIDEALVRMGRKGVVRIDEAVGREISLREGARALLVPGISRVGSQYVISAKLVDPSTGAEVKAYAQPAPAADDILPALGELAETLRSDLGESIESIRQDNRPLPRVTTASLTALQSFADGRDLWSKAQYREAMVHFERAVEQDPDFAIAHATMGSNLLSFVINDPGRGRQHYERALALTDRITERERMYVQAQYAANVGNRDGAVDLYRAYLYRYPDDHDFRYNFGNLLRDLGRYEEAAAEYEHVARLVPSSFPAHINLATVHTLSGRPQEALVAYDKAFVLEPSLKAGGNINHEYGFALVRAGRVADARQVLELPLADQNRRAGGLRSLALLDLYLGKHRDAAIKLEESAAANLKASRILSAGRDFWYLAAARDGRGDRNGQIAALDESARLMQQSQSPAFITRVGVAYARAGELRKAENLLVFVRTLREQTTPGDEFEVLRLQGELQMARKQFSAAQDSLKAAERVPGQTATLVADSVARLHDATGDVDSAIQTYDLLLRQAALGWEGQLAWLDAHYRVARLHAQRGDRDRARARLDTLLHLWKDADADVTLLRAAQALRAGV